VADWLALSVITVGLDPTIELGPLTLAWHGITIALGILIGGRQPDAMRASGDSTPGRSTRSP
jgi:hypothetical protein